MNKKIENIIFELVKTLLLNWNKKKPLMYIYEQKLSHSFDNSTINSTPSFFFFRLMNEF